MQPCDGWSAAGGVAVVVKVTVELAVRRELRRLKVQLGSSSLAAAAVALARQVDDQEQPAAAAAAAARELRLTMAVVRASADVGVSRIDEIAARRARRRSEAYG